MHGLVELQGAGADDCLLHLTRPESTMFRAQELISVRGCHEWPAAAVSAGAAPMGGNLSGEAMHPIVFPVHSSPSQFACSCHGCRCCDFGRRSGQTTFLRRCLL